MPTPNHIYVLAAHVAAASGLPLLTLINKHVPDHWGSPREINYTRRGLRFLEESLPELVSALMQGGETDAGLRLRTWLASIATRRAHEAALAEIAAGKPVSVAREQLTPELVGATTRSRRHASDVEPSPYRDEDL